MILAIGIAVRGAFAVPRMGRVAGRPLKLAGRTNMVLTPPLQPRIMCAKSASPNRYSQPDDLT